MGSCSSSEAAASHAAANPPAKKEQPVHDDVEPSPREGAAEQEPAATPQVAGDAAPNSQPFQPSSDIRDDYTFLKVLGKGNFGTAHMVTKNTTGETFAVKSISKTKLVTAEDVEDVKREIQILQHLRGHENVVYFEGWYEDARHIHLVMECCEGGELFDMIAARGHFSEKQAAELMRTVLSVVNHCHTMNVVHRDIKPENFLLTSKAAGATLKATDFGLSRFFMEQQPMDEVVGSPYYIAPEVLKRQYGKEADIWSCGVMLHIMLCGWPPFCGDNTQQIFRSIIAAPLSFQSSPWLRISDAAKDVVRRMLSRDPKRRLTAEQVLKHPWMQVNGVALDDPMVPEVLTRFRAFTGMNLLKKQFMQVVAQNLPASEIQGIHEMFMAMDHDRNGTITLKELRDGLRTKGAGLASVEVEDLLEHMDLNCNQMIDYEEFMAATLHVSKLNREETMMETFKHFDKDNNGMITRDELEETLVKISGRNADLDAMIAEADTNQDGKICYLEFCLMMRKNDVAKIKAARTALRRGHVSDIQINDEILTDPDSEVD